MLLSPSGLEKGSPPPAGGEVWGGFVITPRLGGCWEAEVPAGVLPSRVSVGFLGCRQGCSSWRWGWLAANTPLGPQIRRDWEGEEGSSVSSKFPPFFRLVA